jgi:TonB family protein
MPETPQNSGSKHPQKDRRLHARQRIHSLSYAKIGDGNGGIVLNISEGGISVQAAGVLDDSETVPLWLEIPRLPERVEVTGEIVWLSPSRKEAGLRFVDLSESALREIRKWMAQEAAPEKFEDETEPANEEQNAPLQAIERHETLALEPRGEDIAVKDNDQEFESEPESIEEFATGEQEEQEEEVREEDRVETETGIDEKPVMEEVPAAGARADLRTTEEATSAKQSETGQQEAEEEPEAEEKHETEDDLIQSFGPPVVPFERRPHASFSSMSAISGASRAAQNLAIAPPIAHTIPPPLAEQSAPPVSAAPSDWKDFRVQLQTGWFLAALVLLLALISFIAGMAVRRGALNGVIGELEDSQVPKSVPSPDASVPLANSSGNATANAGATPVNPLSIEIVDMVNRRWMIPAGTGANHANTAAPGASETTGGSAVSPTPEADQAAPSGIDLHAQASNRPAGSPSTAGPAPAAKPNVPLVLSLPETPISASGSVAISSQRSVPVPSDGSQAAKNARNLQVGQLVNLVEPAYPPEAVQQKIEGVVKLHAVIGTDGVIESLAQVSGPQILVNASMAAVRNWKYSPTRMNGQAVETQEDISFVFRLPK